MPSAIERSDAVHSTSRRPSDFRLLSQLSSAVLYGNVFGSTCVRDASCSFSTALPRESQSGMRSVSSGLSLNSFSADSCSMSV